jgi:hypothetical protein
MRRLAWMGLCVAGAVFALHTLGQMAVDPWDDALFFKRFALNTLDHGVAAWNLSDGPVHGNTTQLFQLLSTGPRSWRRSPSSLEPSRGSRIGRSTRARRRCSFAGSARRPSSS